MSNRLRSDLPTSTEKLRDCTHTSPNTAHVPKVRMGEGNAPVKIVKHVPKVRMGEGNASVKIVKHVPKVRMGEGNAPVKLIQHVPAPKSN